MHTCRATRAEKFRLRCRLAELRVGNIDYLSDVANVESAYVVSQSPAFEMCSSIEMGTAVDVVVASEKREVCQ